jgi:hypothetical protein
MRVSVREVPTLPLFDPVSGEGPPRDAIELYVETPISLGVYYSAALDSVEYGASPAKAQYETTAILAARDAGIEALLAHLRREGSYVKVGQHYPTGRRGETHGLHLPGNLYMTRVAHLTVPIPNGEDPDTARLHDHIYIGAYAPCEDDSSHLEEKGRLWPVDELNLRNVMTSLAALQIHALENSLVTTLDVEWEYPSETNRKRCRELIDPPFVDVQDYPRLFCEGPARSSACQGPSWPEREAAALAQEPDAIEERIDEIRWAVRSEYRKAVTNRRIIVRDVLYPPQPRDPAGWC